MSVLFCASSLYAQDINDVKIKKDTLFLEFDKDYLQQGKYNLNHYYLKDALKDNGSSEIFFFEVMETVNKAKIGGIMNLKSFIRNSEFYDEDRESNRLDDFGLASHLENYSIFLVEFGCEPKIISVYPRTEID